MASRYKWLFIKVRGVNLPWLEYNEIAPLDADLAWRWIHPEWEAPHA
jgi:hypothetical protein